MLHVSSISLLFHISLSCRIHPAVFSEWIEDEPNSGPSQPHSADLGAPTTSDSQADGHDQPSLPSCPGTTSTRVSSQKKGRGQKRKRIQEREGSLESLRESHQTINNKTLEFMQAKHEKEMAALDSFQQMCNTVNSFFSKLTDDYDNIFTKKN